MKRKLSIVATILSLAIIASAGVFYFKSTRATAQGQFVGYVDSDRIIEEYAPAKEANSAWDNFQAQQEEELRAKIVEKYKTDDIATLPREQQLEVQKMIEESEGMRQQQFEKIRQEKWEPAKQKIQTTIESVAQSKGITVVLERKAVLAGGQDLTDEVIATLKK